MMTSMPEVTHLRRPPVLLPPMIRTMDLTTPLNESASQSKTTRPKSAEKRSKSSLEKQQEKDHVQRYVFFSSNLFILLH